MLTGTSSFAQGLTQANEPAIGATADMFLCDSFAPNYANVTGSGVTWDYSAIGGFAGEMRTLTIVDPATTSNSADFPSATKAVTIENFLTTYWASSPTERNSPGFVFNEPTFGEVKAVFNTDPQKLAEYEFSLNDQVNDNFAGTMYFSFSGLPMSPAAAGTSFSKIDGTGTLKLNATTTLTGVLRCVTIDTLNTTVPVVGDIQLIRAQYEYYHHATGNMPVFTHTSAKIMTVGGTDPLTEFTVVLNSVEPDNFVSVKETQKTSFNVFPNPAKESLTISGDFAGASAKIVDQSGREVKNISVVNPGSVITLNELQKGIYFLVLNTNGISSVEKFMKN